MADAIRHGDDHHLIKELGDLLLRVLPHVCITAEDGRLDLETVAAGITSKLNPAIRTCLPTPRRQTAMRCDAPRRQSSRPSGSSGPPAFRRHALRSWLSRPGTAP
ncbi:MAG: MazG nucleotide pyrophosphohydrolase domain-containing protein [Synechococcus sp.]|nr:MazG nucleotide pyrophosphohydrolase domain-containing protein [Synechococcus sp.]